MREILILFPLKHSHLALLNDIFNSNIKPGNIFLVFICQNVKYLQKDR